MTDIIHVPLGRLSLWDGNVRKTDISAGINELADSIASHGLLQSLVVRKGKRGKYDIVAGQRRFLALQSLAKEGVIEKDCAIPCTEANAEHDPAELSLAENIVRAPMHPADQFEAFRAIIDAGVSVADVAARFGIAESVVTKRLKLGRLSPVVINAYRAGDLDLEEAQAFTVTDDHAAQERVFSELPEWNRSPDTIRNYLTADEIPTSESRIRFIGVDAYRDAGGVIRHDLFDEDGSGYLTDVALLDRLVAEKLAAAATEVSAEGWNWVEPVPNADYSFLASFKRFYPVRAELSEPDQSELDRLTQEYDELIDSDDDTASDRIAKIEQRIEVLDDRAESWPAEALANSGAVITIDRHGDLRIERGLVRKSDQHKMTTNDNSIADTSRRASRPDGLSSRLVEDLTAQRSAAIGAELLAQPDVALAAVVHALALDVLYVGHAGSCLKLHCGSDGLSTAIASPETCKGLQIIEQERARAGDRLPGNPKDLLDWLLARSREELLELLALVAATSVDAVQRKTDPAHSLRLADGEALAGALRLDMSRWFTPGAENYFGRVNRAQILAAIDEAKGDHAPALDKLKKSELAIRAEFIVAGTGWMPEPLRLLSTDDVALAAE